MESRRGISSRSKSSEGVVVCAREGDCCDGGAGGGGGDVDTAAGPGCGSRAGLLLQYCARGFLPVRWQDAFRGDAYARASQS